MFRKSKFPGINKFFFELEINRQSPKSRQLTFADSVNLLVVDNAGLENAQRSITPDAEQKPTTTKRKTLNTTPTHDFFFRTTKKLKDSMPTTTTAQLPHTRKICTKFIVAFVVGGRHVLIKSDDDRTRSNLLLPPHMNTHNRTLPKKKAHSFSGGTTVLHQ